MNEKLTHRQLVLIGSMLFGLFFGAGNLIFPLILGAKAGQNLPAALLGLLITAVGIPLLGVMSIGLARSEGLLELSGRVSPWFRILFTCALYLTIGPLFAIPRCAATSFTIGVSPFVKENIWLFSVLLRGSAAFFPEALQNPGLGGEISEPGLSPLFGNHTGYGAHEPCPANSLNSSQRRLCPLRILRRFFAGI